MHQAVGRVHTCATWVDLLPDDQSQVGWLSDGEEGASSSSDDSGGPEPQAADVLPRRDAQGELGYGSRLHPEVADAVRQQRQQPPRFASMRRARPASPAQLQQSPLPGEPVGAGEAEQLDSDIAEQRKRQLEACREWVVHTGFVRDMYKSFAAIIGDSPDDYGAKSGRIAGATRIYEEFGQIVADRILKDRGRWCSDCKWIYARLSARAQNEVSRRMARVGGPSFERSAQWVQPARRVG